LVICISKEGKRDSFSDVALCCLVQILLDETFIDKLFFLVKEILFMNSLIPTINTMEPNVTYETRI